MVLWYVSMTTTFDQAPQAKQNLQEEQFHWQVRRANALARVAAHLNAQLDITTVMNTICQESAQALNAPAAAVLLYNQTKDIFYPAATYGLPSAFKEQYKPNPRSVYEQHPQPNHLQIVVPDLRSLPNLPNAQLFIDYHIHAIVVVSLDRSDHLFGALSVYDFDPGRTFSQDEIGLLRGIADQAAQAIHNAQLFAKEQHRANQFRLLGEIGRHITSILDIDELFQQIVQSTQLVVNYHHVGIALVEEDEIVYKAGSGYYWDYPIENQEEVLVRFPITDEGISGWVVQNGQPLVIPDVRQNVYYQPRVNNKILSEAVVPIKIKGEVIGILNVESEELNAFDKNDIVILQTMADQAAVAMENALLYKRTHQLAVLEERQRLARDLHDSVAQALYSQTLYGEAAARQLKAGNMDLAIAHVDQLRQIAQQALQEMRLLIFELRPPILVEEGLLRALQVRLEAVEQRAGREVQFIVEGNINIPAKLELPLYRIAQEALNNALKHAKATKVSIYLKQSARRIALTIVDNGCGFTPADIQKKGSMGLKGMQERAARINGRLTITSKPGEGASYTCGGARMSKAINVFIVDDHAVVREGIRALLATEPNIAVVGTAANGVEAIPLIQQKQPDVVLMDLVMPEMNGIETIQALVSQQVQSRILVLTSFATNDMIFPAIKAGALGYLLKDSGPQTLIDAIQQVYKGESWLHPKIARKLLQEISPLPQPKTAVEPLTARELEVLRQIAQGLTNQEIAETLNISEATVRTHVSHILKKRHLASRTQAALYALREGLASL